MFADLLQIDGPGGLVTHRGDNARSRYYFEYSSTTSDSLMVIGRSERCGTALNVPFMAFASTSSHSGKPRCSAASTAPLMRSCPLAFSVTSTTSPCRRTYDGM